MKIVRRIIIGIVITHWIGLTPTYANGLLTSFVDIMVRDVPIGETYDRGPRMELVNSGNTPLDVQIDVLSVDPKHLEKGTLPLPDSQWIEVRPNRLMIEPHESASCEVRITVPNKRAYRRKRYEAKIWTRSQPTEAQGVTLGAGLLSRFRFQTQ